MIVNGDQASWRVRPNGFVGTRRKCAITTPTLFLCHAEATRSYLQSQLHLLLLPGQGKTLRGRCEFFHAQRVLEEFTRQYIEAQQVGEVHFSWQGGEPTLMGLDFFRKAVELQRKYRKPGIRIKNSFQTNGILLDDEWCRFFKEHDFLVGLSMDGPRDLHDAYRVDKGGKPTFDKVYRALKLLQRHGVARV